MTSSRTSWSFVGAWTISANPANATIPICVVAPCRSMNEDAAVLGGDAAGSAAMSVEHMLRETSSARITVVWPVGTGTMRPAAPSRRSGWPSAMQDQRERQVPADPRRARQSLVDERQAREAQARPPPAQGPDPGADEHRQHGQQEEQPGHSGDGSASGNRPTHSERREPADQQEQHADAGEQRGDLHRLGA